MGDIEQITADLEKFCSTQENQSQEFASPSKFDNIPESLDAILRAIAANGQLPYSFEWKHVALVVRQKILYCIDQMNNKAKYSGTADEYVESCDMVLQRIEQFNEAPFTLQRLCELVLMPDKYYKDTNKYIHALLKCLLVVSGWRKQVQPDLPKQNEAPRIEPDSTTNTEQSQQQQQQQQVAAIAATAAGEVKEEATPTQQPDSTTNEESEEKPADTKTDNDEVKDEPVFLERPKHEPDDDDDEGGIFSRQKSPIKTSPVKRKVQILPSNIKLNVGNGKAEPNTDDTSEDKAATPATAAAANSSETETDEDKRKRKRSVDNEETDELSSAASTPQKQQKTE